MDIFAILDSYGIPLAVAALFAAYIHKQESFIRNELLEEIEQNEQNGIERAKRLEGILIKLIDNAKQNDMKLTDLNGSVKLLLHYLAEEKAKNKEQLLKKIKEWC